MANGRTLREAHTHQRPRLDNCTVDYLGRIKPIFHDTDSSCMTEHELCTDESADLLSSACRKKH